MARNRFVTGFRDKTASVSVCLKDKVTYVFLDKMDAVIPLLMYVEG